MPWYIHTDDDGNQTKFWSDEEIETDDEEESEDDDSEGGDSEDESDDEDNGDEEPAAESQRQYEEVEEVFREERATLRSIVDLGELRRKRQDFEKLLNAEGASPHGLARVNDLLELVDQRETDIRAKRLLDRKR